MTDNAVHEARQRIEGVRQQMESGNRHMMWGNYHMVRYVPGNSVPGSPATLPLDVAQRALIGDTMVVIELIELGAIDAATVEWPRMEITDSWGRKRAKGHETVALIGSVDMKPLIAEIG